jgi:Spy/CpxP family protein refolding chaperone
MKRLAMMFAAAVLVSGSAAVAQAQQGPGAPPPGGQGGRGMMNSQRMMEVLFKDITLTADQQTKLKEVAEKYDPQMMKMREEMMAARQSGQPMAPEAMQKMRALQTEQRDAMRAVLTAEQQVVFDKNIAEMPQGRGAGGPGGPPPGGRPPRA